MLLRLAGVIDEDEAVKFVLFIFGGAFAIYLLPMLIMSLYPVIEAVLIATVVVVVLNFILPRSFFSVAFSAAFGGLSSGIGLAITWIFILARHLVTFIVWCYPVMLVLFIILALCVSGVQKSPLITKLFSDFFEFTGAGLAFGLIYAYGKKFLTKQG
jgi:hypothetical protein